MTLKDYMGNSVKERVWVALKTKEAEEIQALHGTQFHSLSLSVSSAVTETLKPLFGRLWFPVVGGGLSGWEGEKTDK